jgi:hypothetical protein
MVKRPTVCAMSRKKTPSDARSQDSPMVKRMHGVRMNGRRTTVHGGGPCNSVRATTRTIRLTPAWNRPVAITTHGRTSSGNTIFFT